MSFASMVCLLKFVTGLLPRSMSMIGHRPPFVVCSSWCRSKNVLLWRLVLSFAVCLQPPRMRVLFRGG